MISIYVNNTPSQYKTINSTYNSVTLQLQPPILLDPNKKYQLRVLNANVVYCQPNITSANNKFSYWVNGVNYVKTIPIGLYGITDIDNTIARYTTAQNGTQLFSFQPNEATSTIIVYFAQANTYIDTDNVANSIMPILGFTDGQFGGVSAGGSVESTQQAELNTLTQILVSCNITNGSYLNDQFTNVIAGIPINVAPYSSIPYAPIHPTRNNIFKNRIDTLTITLSSQDLLDLDFTKENTSPPEKWNLTLTIEDVEMARLL